MKTRWLEGLDNESDKEEVKYEFEKAFKARKRLAQLLEKEIASLVVNMTNEDHFEKEWSLIQADRIGHIKAYRKIIGLLE